MKHSIIALAMTTLTLISPAVAKSNHSHQSTVAFQVIKQSLVINKNDVKSIKMINNQNGRYSIDILLTPAATQRFTRLTQANIQRKLMLTVGNCIINIATIQTKLGGHFTVPGLAKSSAKKILIALSDQG